jgi:hypothetical protein
MKGFAMGEIGKYIYGIINCNKEQFFDIDDIGAFDDVHIIRKSEDATDYSKIFKRVYTIPYSDISAVVSDSKKLDFSHTPKDVLAKLLLWHQQVIEKIMRGYAIIPMRLGTFNDNQEQVSEILAKGYRTIKDIFERIKYSIEIDVAVTLNDFNSFLQEISHGREIEQLKQSLLSNKEGVTKDDQMKFGILVKKYLDETKGKYAGQIQSALGAQAQNFKAHDLMDDKMVFNTAFLIDKSKQKDFEREVDRLNYQFEEKLNFRCVGPLPPYSFYTLEVIKAHFVDVDWARKQLGITDDFITATDIKKAHRRVALSCHPDKNPDTQGIEKKFNDMTRAYRILLDYYRASNQANQEQEDGCYFNEEAFEKNAVLVTTVE